MKMQLYLLPLAVFLRDSFALQGNIANHIVARLKNSEHVLNNFQQAAKKGKRLCLSELTTASGEIASEKKLIEVVEQTEPRRRRKISLLDEQLIKIFDENGQDCLLSLLRTGVGTRAEVACVYEYITCMLPIMAEAKDCPRELENWFIECKKVCEKRLAFFERVKEYADDCAEAFSLCLSEISEGVVGSDES